MEKGFRLLPARRTHEAGKQLPYRAEFRPLLRFIRRLFFREPRDIRQQQPFQPPESYLRNAELYEEGQTGNYNMLDGRLNNEPPERPDLTDGQTYEEIRELAPETLPEEKPTLMERLKAERPEHEAKQAAPPVPERER